MSNSEFENVGNALKIKAREEAITTTAKWFISGIVALFAISAAGWWFYLQKNLDDHIKLLSSIPEGAVMAFNKACPAEGWAPLEEARGRFIVGAGAGEDINGTVHNFIMGKGKNDGEYTHTLTTKEMPSHSHQLERSNLTDVTKGVNNSYPLFLGDTRIDSVNKPSTLAEGGNEPHNNIPPYYALELCVRKLEK